MGDSTGGGPSVGTVDEQPTAAPAKAKKANPTDASGRPSLAQVAADRADRTRTRVRNTDPDEKE